MKLVTKNNKLRVTLPATTENDYLYLREISVQTGFGTADPNGFPPTTGAVGAIQAPMLRMNQSRADGYVQWPICITVEFTLALKTVADDLSPVTLANCNASISAAVVPTNYILVESNPGALLDTPDPWVPRLDSGVPFNAKYRTAYGTWYGEKVTVTTTVHGSGTVSFIPVIQFRQEWFPRDPYDSRTPDATLNTLNQTRIYARAAITCVDDPSGILVFKQFTGFYNDSVGTALDPDPDAILTTGPNAVSGITAYDGVDWDNSSETINASTMQMLYLEGQINTVPICDACDCSPLADNEVWFIDSTDPVGNYVFEGLQSVRNLCGPGGSGCCSPVVVQLNGETHELMYADGSLTDSSGTWSVEYDSGFWSYFNNLTGEHFSAGDGDCPGLGAFVGTAGSVLLVSCGGDGVGPLGGGGAGSGACCQNLTITYSSGAVGTFPMSGGTDASGTWSVAFIAGVWTYTNSATGEVFSGDNGPCPSLGNFSGSLGNQIYVACADTDTNGTDLV